MKPQAPLHLEVRRHGVPALYTVLRPGTYAVGSAPACDVQLDDPEVARLHATVLHRDGRTYVSPASDRPLLLNGERLFAMTQLLSSDELRVGPFVFRTRPAPAPRQAEGAPLADPEGPTERVHLPPALPQPRLTKLAPPAPPSEAQRPSPAPANGGRLTKLAPPAPPPEARRRSRALHSAPPRATAHRTAPGATTARPGEARLHLSLFWGEQRRECRSFEPARRTPVLASADDAADMPLWGFTLPASGWRLVESTDHGFILKVPPRARLSRQEGEGYVPISRTELEGGVSLKVRPGQAFRLEEGLMRLEVDVRPHTPAARHFQPRRLPWLYLGCLGVLLCLFGGFIARAPRRDTLQVASPRPKDVAVRLVMQEPKKREAAQKRVEQLAERRKKAEQKPARRTAQKRRVRPPAPSKALQSLARLTRAGPAAKTLFGDVSQLSFKNARPSALSGVKVASAVGLGTGPSLAAGVERGAGGMGAAMLRSGSIGALGARGVGGKGRVGGTVARASPRAVSVRGSIDRDAVARVVNAHLQEVRGCYETALLKAPGLSGKVVLEWTLSTSGQVLTSRTKSSSLRSAQVEGCILRHIRGWRFPPAKGGEVVVSYPFLFNSVGY